MLLVLLACTAPADPDAPRDLSVRFDETRENVAYVTWTTDAAVSARVSWRIEGGGDPPTPTASPAVTATEHAHTLLGLRPDTGYTLVVEQEGVEVASTYVKTPEAPSWVPAFRTLEGAWDAFVAVPYHSLTDEGNHGVVVLDGGGVPVWWESLADFATTAVWDGTTLVYNSSALDDAHLFRTPLLGASEGIDLPGAHHEFLLLPDGAVAYLRADVRDVDGEAVMGDELVVRQADGSEHVVWNAFETLEIERHEAWETGSLGGDWTHANGLAYDASNDRWVVSLYWLERFVEIDGATGQVLRTLDGRSSAEPFGPQHAPEITADGVRFFDNELLDGQSRLVEIGWDGQLRWMWTPDHVVHALVLGDVDRLDDGRTLSSWGPERAILGLSADDALNYAVEIEQGVIVGQVDGRASLYE